MRNPPKNYFFSGFILFSGFVCLILLGTVTVDRVIAAPWWQSSINVESKVGTDRSIQSLDVMYPLAHTDDSLTFTDLRGRIDDNQSVELNLGLAHRLVTKDPLGISDGAVLGYYGFFDRLESQYDNTFYQGTVGFEYFTEKYSLRLNGYFPENETKLIPSSDTPRLQLSGPNIYFGSIRRTEQPLPGYDIELGRTVRYDWGQLYGRASYFRFDDSNAAEVEGSRFRAGVQVPGERLHESLPEDSQFTLGAEWQNDQVRDEQTFGVVRMRVPFGTIEDRKSNIEKNESNVEGQKSNVEGQSTVENANSEPSTVNSELRSWQKNRLTERIERDVDIVTAQDEVIDTSPAVNATTGRTVTGLTFAQANATGEATVNSPGSLKKAVTKAGTDGLVMVLPGSDTLTTSGVTLPEGMELRGGQYTTTLKTSSGDAQTTITVGTPGTPVLEGKHDTSVVVSLRDQAGHQTIRNLVIAGGRYGVSGGDNDNVTLSDVTAKNNSFVGVRIRGDTFTAQNISTFNSGRTGIFLSGDNHVVSNLRADSAGRRGVDLAASHTTADSITATKTDLTGVRVGGSHSTVKRVTVVSNTGPAGVEVESAIGGQTAQDIVVDQVTLRNATSRGLEVNSSDSVQIKNATIEDVDGPSVFINQQKNLTFDSTTVTNPGDDAIVMDATLEDIDGIDFGSNFTVNGPVGGTIVSGKYSQTIKNISGFIDAPNTSCSVDGATTITNSTLTIDDGGATKVFNETNC